MALLRLLSSQRGTFCKRGGDFALVAGNMDAACHSNFTAAISPHLAIRRLFAEVEGTAR